MDFVSMAVVAAVAVGGFLAAYKFKPASPLLSSKPSFCLLPKFKGLIDLRPNIAQAPQPAESLAEGLAESGFSVAARSDSELVLSRGSVLGDFSVKIAKANLRFEVPLQSPAAFIIEYGSFAAFDTGDLWQFAQELKSSLERAV